jgi:hypothetical protein
MTQLDHHGIPRLPPYGNGVDNYDSLAGFENEALDDTALSSASPKKRGRKKKGIRYALVDREKRVVTAEARLLNADDSALMNERFYSDNVRYKDSLPFFKLLVRLFRTSIDDYCASPANNAGEIAFWQGSMCHYYGEMLCEFARLIFDIDMSLEGMRRAAEIEMGLPKYTLSPHCNSLLAAEQVSVRISKSFSEIVEKHGHLHDPDADAFFEVRRRPRRP